MAAYVTLDEFKAWKRSGASGLVGTNVDPDIEDEDDAMMTIAIEAAAERINHICHRTFEEAPDTATERTFFSAHDGRFLFVDDFTGFAEATRDDVAFLDFVVMPHDADRPASYLKGSFGSQRAIKLSAKWGWPATPGPIKYVNLVLGLHLYERRHSPFGIEGAADIGFIRVSGADRDVSEMLEGFVRLRARVGR